MKISLLLIAITFLSFELSVAQSRKIAFAVTFKGKAIGTLVATEEKTGTKIVRDLRNDTDTKILVMSIHVESEVSSTHEGVILISSTAYRHASRGAEDVYSKVTRLADGKYQCERNGVTRIETKPITVKVGDLYFNEPVGLTLIFSTMYTDFLQLKRLPDGRYLLVTPDNKNSWFTYTNGKLMSVESETPVGNVLSKRI